MRQGPASLAQLADLPQPLEVLEPEQVELRSGHLRPRQETEVPGFSMGAYFSNHAGCQMSDVIHGIAPHSGSYPGSCPNGPIPVMIWHGTVESSCGPDAREVWAERNGCEATFDTVQVQNGTCEWQHGCPPGAQVVLCMMNDMNDQGSGGEGLIGAPRLRERQRDDVEILQGAVGPLIAAPISTVRRSGHARPTEAAETLAALSS